MQDFKKLSVWQKSYGVTLEVFRCTKRFPFEERFGLTSQTRRAAMSIEANIAEGCGRGTKPDFARFLQQAMGSASELECHLLIARDLRILNDLEHHNLENRVLEVKRMLTSLMERVRRKSLLRTDN